jgi:hypothetical protein
MAMSRKVLKTFKLNRMLDEIERSAGTHVNPVPGRLIVSLTSYPKRFHYLHIVLKSLINQSIVPTQIVLYLDYGTENDLPASVRRLVGETFRIEVRPPIRSYGKLLNALHDYPEAYIVTVDDDVIYPGNMLHSLTSAIAEQPGMITCLRAHRLHFTVDGYLLPYRSWPLNVDDSFARRPSVDLVPTGVGGVLYPPGCLHPRAIDIETALRLCPTADDIWFYWMARLAGTFQMKVGPALRLVHTPDSQEAGLLHANLAGANDRQIHAMWREFGPPPGLPAGLSLPPDA